jgi:amino acid adenylation domain-containing protein
VTALVLPDLLTEAADQFPDRTAVIDGARSCTYADLDDYASRIAHALRRWGVGPGTRVGVHLEKSVHAVAALYGIMLAGASYVPVDPDGPMLRAAAILADAEVSAVVVDEERLTMWTCGDISLPSSRVVLVDTNAPDGTHVQVVGASELAGMPTGRLPRQVISNDLAYILYTSGSTGTPKGVMLTHRNALAFVEWAARHYMVQQEDVVSSIAPLHFDLSIFDLFAAARAGAAVSLIARSKSVFPVEFRRALEDSHVTICYAVPSLLTMLSMRGGLSSDVLPDLRRILFAGEVFPSRHLRSLMKQLPHVSFHNLYGPTETNVCTYYDLDHTPPVDDEPISIGLAIDDVQLVIVDEGGAPVPDGEVGELLVRGPTVMTGYFGDPARTQRAMLAHPSRDDVSDRCYGTGDLVRLRADGNLEFLGRRDNQIKSRGYRIELGEVEVGLHSHPDVIEAVVTAIPDELVGNRLTAVVVGRNLTADALAEHCRDRLPGYMFPDEVIVVDELPKTSTGKIDRQAVAVFCRTYKRETA